MDRRFLAAAGAFLFGALASPADAQQRTRLTVYTALESEQLGPLKAAAEAALGDIGIDWVRDGTGAITARLLAERAEPRADLVWGLSAFSLLGLEALDMLEPFTPNGAEILRSDMRSDRVPMTWTGMSLIATAICYNTAVAQQRSLPRPAGWADLLNPALHGQISMPNPSSSATGFMAVAGWMTTMGEQAAWTFMDRLHGNMQAYVHAGAAPCDAAARGEPAMGISLDGRAAALRDHGAPIDVIVPTEGVGFDVKATAILRGTRNLDAARRLAGFAVTRAAMELYGRHASILALPDVTAAAQMDPPDLEQRLARIDIREMSAQRDRILAEWTRRYDGKSAPR